MIIDGSHIPAASAATGFVLDASHCLLRGLIISGFNVGVSVSALTPITTPWSATSSRATPSAITTPTP